MELCFPGSHLCWRVIWLDVVWMTAFPSSFVHISFTLLRYCFLHLIRAEASHKLQWRLVSLSGLWLSFWPHQSKVPHLHCLAINCTVPMCLGICCWAWAVKRHSCICIKTWEKISGVERGMERCWARWDRLLSVGIFLVSSPIYAWQASLASELFTAGGALILRHGGLLLREQCHFRNGV